MTGVAQNHSTLFMTAAQRMPGLHEGQLYSYPSKRWRKRRRQYLSIPRGRRDIDTENSELLAVTVGGDPAVAHSEDSKDSSGLKEDSATKVAVSDTSMILFMLHFNSHLYLYHIVFVFP